MIHLIKIGEKCFYSRKIFEKLKKKNEFRLSQLDLSSSKSMLNKHIYNAKLAGGDYMVCVEK